MDFAGMNYVAVPVAALASFVFGSSWYAVLGSAWATAVERSKAELGSAKLAMLITAICLVIMAFVPDWPSGNRPGHLGERDHFGSLGLDRVHRHHACFKSCLSRHPRALTLIDGGHWLGVLLIQGAIIGWFGV